MLHAASASAPTTVRAPGWICACLICNEGSQGCAEGSESGENIYPLTAISPCFPINQFLCPLVLVLLHTGACSGMDVGGMMHFLGSDSTVETGFIWVLVTLEGWFQVYRIYILRVFFNRNKCLHCVDYIHAINYK